VQGESLPLHIKSLCGSKQSRMHYMNQRKQLPVDPEQVLDTLLQVHADQASPHRGAPSSSVQLRARCPHKMLIASVVDTCMF
jgi:hypothetical protein